MIKFSSPYSQIKFYFFVEEELEYFRVTFFLQKEVSEKPLYLRYALGKSEISQGQLIDLLKNKSEDLEQIKNWNEPKLLKEIQDPIVYFFLDVIDARLNNQSVYEWVVEHIAKHQQPWNHVNLNYIRGNLGE
jgi:hypothetical protein